MPEQWQRKRGLEERLLSKTEKTSSCWLWTGGTNGHGYGVMGDQERRTRYVHRLSYELFVGPIPPGTEIAHTCDVRNCLMPEHLQPMTHVENESDKVNKERSSRGEDQWRSVLTEDGVRAIRARVADGESRKVLAAEFSVSVSNIDLIVTRRRWKHVV